MQDLQFFPLCHSVRKPKPEVAESKPLGLFSNHCTSILLSVALCTGRILWNSALARPFLQCCVCFCRIGGESLAVAQNTYAVSWFKGKELNLVFGLQLSMARIVSGHTRAVPLLLGLLLGGLSTAGVPCWGWGMFTSGGSHGSFPGDKRSFFLVLSLGILFDQIHSTQLSL